MSFVIQDMTAFDDLFKEPEKAPEPEPVKADTPAYVPSWLRPVRPENVADILAELQVTLDEFDPAKYPEVEFRFSESKELYEAWDWETSLLYSHCLKCAVLAVLQVRHGKKKDELQSNPQRQPTESEQPGAER